MTGLTINFTKHCTVDVGAYIEASTGVIIANGNNDRTHACMELGPYRNRLGSINYFILDIGRVVVRSKVKQIIWPERLLMKATALGEKDRKSILN